MAKANRQSTPRARTTKAPAHTVDPIYQKMAFHWTAYMWAVAAIRDFGRVEKRAQKLGVTKGAYIGSHWFYDAKGVKRYCRELSATIRRNVDQGGKIERAALKRLRNDRTRTLQELERQAKARARIGYDEAKAAADQGTKALFRYESDLCSTTPKTYAGLLALVRYVSIAAPVTGLFDDDNGKSLFESIAPAILRITISDKGYDDGFWRSAASDGHAALMRRVQRFSDAWGRRAAKAAKAAKAGEQ